MRRGILPEGDPASLSNEALLAYAGADAEERQYYENLVTMLKPSRLRHSLGVMLLAVALARHYGNVPVEKARTAGLLHDCGKYLGGALEHGPLGAELAESRFGVKDKDILDAIRWHTTGHPDMSPLEKIIFAADYAEPFREPRADLEPVREMLFEDLDQAVLMTAEGTVRYLEEQGADIEPVTRDVVSWYRERKNTMEHNTEELMKSVYKALSDKQGQDITVIDIRGISTLADYFIITHGNNTPHVEALVDAVQEEMAKQEVECKSLEGLRGGRWVLLDYGDLVVNVFSKEDRLWYDLERIWRDGKIVRPEDF